MQKKCKEVKMTKTFSHKEICDLIKLAQSGNLVARNKVIQANIGLIKKELHQTKYQNFKSISEDLEIEAVFGLINAIENFNTNLGWKFSTYALPCIKQSISKYLSENTKAFSVSKDFVSKAHYVKELFNTFDERGVGPIPVSANKKINFIAKEIGIPIKKCKELLAFNPHAESFEKEFENVDDNETLSQTLKDTKNLQPDEAYERKCTIQAIQNGLKKLQEKDNRMYYVLTEHCGYFSKDGLGRSFSDIAQDIGLSKQQACNIANNALKFLRNIPEINELENVA